MQRRKVPPAVVVAATRSASDSILRCRKGEWFRLQQSLRLRRIVRLQRRRGVQAGTGCHEGGIILSKKPPEWHLPLPQPLSSYDEPHPIPIFVAAEKNGPPAVAVETTTSAADSNFPCGKKEWPACNDLRDNDLPRPIPIFAAAKKNGPPAARSWDAGRDRMPRRWHNPR